MRKNGFTLIELLAVIVILAIIALIATPIILGIINDAREKANERSVELYASAVRNAIAAYQLTGTSAPTSFGDLDIQYDGNVVCTTEELYEDGSFYLDSCTVNGGEKTYSYGTKQEKPIEPGKMSSVCNPISVATEGTYTAGDKYECKVDPNKPVYTFYVLTSVTDESATSVNLIMDSNINISGNAVKGQETDKGNVAWYESENVNTYGPITAMNHLQTATASWTNVNEQIINSFAACDSRTSCIDKEMQTYNVYARMPYYSEISDYSSSKNNAYLYNNLDVYCQDVEGNDISCEDASEKYGVFEDGVEHIQGVAGYWLFSSDASNPDMVWFIWYEFAVNGGMGAGYGVRPVINLSI